MASDDQSKALEEAKKLPFADRVAHKGWFVRAVAFEDIGAACEQALSPEDPLFAEVGAEPCVLRLQPPLLLAQTC